MYFELIIVEWGLEFVVNEYKDEKGKHVHTHQSLLIRHITVVNNSTFLLTKFFKNSTLKIVESLFLNGFSSSF